MSHEKTSHLDVDRDVSTAYCFTSGDGVDLVWHTIMYGRGLLRLAFGSGYCFPVLSFPHALCPSNPKWRLRDKGVSTRCILPFLLGLSHSSLHFSTLLCPSTCSSRLPTILYSSCTQPPLLPELVEGEWSGNTANFKGACLCCSFIAIT